MRPAFLQTCGCIASVPSALHVEYTSHGSCCLEQDWPADGRWRSQWAEDDCCLDDILSRSELCHINCRLPWPPLHELDNVSASEIDQQRRAIAGGPIGIRDYPWVGVQQRHTHPTHRRTASADEAARPPRLAICLAGAARGLILPTVWRSIRDTVLSVSVANPPTLFLVLSTGAEEPRGRDGNSEDDDAEQTYLHSSEGAQLLAATLNALQPAAVTFLTGRSQPSCGVPASGQFSKWAECANLVRDYETRNRDKPPFEVLWKSRPDLLWSANQLGLHKIDEIVERVASDRLVAVTTDDLNVFLHASQLSVLSALTPDQMVCPPECATQVWKWMDGRRVYCLLKAAFARRGIHHVDVGGGAAGASEVLQSCSLDWAKGAGVLMAGPGCRELTLQFYGMTTRRTASHPPTTRHAPFKLVRALDTSEHAAGVKRVESRRSTDSNEIASAAAVARALTCKTTDEQRTTWVCSECFASHGVWHGARSVYAGFCDAVNDAKGDCQRGQSGAWPVALGKDALASRVASSASGDGVVDPWTCVERCQKCPRCRFVSYSQRLRKCWWFHACDTRQVRLPHLNTSGGFRTVSVGNEDEDEDNIPKAQAATADYPRCGVRMIVYGSARGVAATALPSARVADPRLLAYLAGFFGKRLSGLSTSVSVTEQHVNSRRATMAVAMALGLS